MRDQVRSPIRSGATSVPSPDHGELDRKLPWRFGFSFRLSQRTARTCPLTVLVLLLAACVAGQVVPRSEAPLTLASAVDPIKFGGRWFVIAHVPYAEERDDSEAYIELQPRGDGGFDERYHYYDSNLMESVVLTRGRYDAVAGSHNALWNDRSRVRRSQMELGVLYVDPDYRYTVIGETGRHFGWIYAREPNIDSSTYADLVAQLSRRGYDTTQLHRLRRESWPLQFGPADK